ncbi:ferritin-like domain-containing protein [Rhodanobacter glycinis]|uniref:Ferritin-like domain-containing protein n=1 Tax=Rhodanobacter glycinis TaxID=582702 RepID=A0A1I4AMK0_9GAMM|nr:ferritin-like domain-containing protein [Rhodanobacter glycinis]SFK56959.1 hypothetical protein SAMN05192579_10418 [Rhodanobacter glycinis]
MDTTDAQPWTLENLDLTRIDVARIRHDEDLFFLVCAASFAEQAAQPHMHELVKQFAGDRAWQAWLRQCWQPEKCQHGHALAAYVRHVWPEYDWQAGFKACLDAAVVQPPELYRERGLTLAARCVIGAGVASHYRALGEITDEPVLRELVACIKRDEVRHFNRFCQQLEQCRTEEGTGRYRMLRAMLGQARRGRAPNHDAALQPVFAQCYPQQVADPASRAQLADRVHQRLRAHFGANTTARMLLKPLDLSPRLHDMLERPLTRFSHRVWPLPSRANAALAPEPARS